MKTLNKETAKEIGFDIDCLPKWADYIAMDKKGMWGIHIDKPVKYNFLNLWSGSHFNEIPEKYAPTNFKGNWTESLFKIERDEK